MSAEHTARVLDLLSEGVDELLEIPNGEIDRFRETTSKIKAELNPLTRGHFASFVLGASINSDAYRQGHIIGKIQSRRASGDRCGYGLIPIEKAEGVIVQANAAVGGFITLCSIEGMKRIVSEFAEEQINPDEVFGGDNNRVSPLDIITISGLLPGIVGPPGEREQRFSALSASIESQVFDLSRLQQAA